MDSLLMTNYYYDQLSLPYMLRSRVKYFKQQCSAGKNEKKWKKECASSHIPHSNIDWECCIQRMAIPSNSDRQSDRKPVSSELHKIILAKV